MADAETDAGGSHCCKVGRSAARYHRPDLDAELRRRHEGGASLRDLERVANRAFLAGAVEGAGSDVLGDVDGILDALAGDGASAGERTELRTRLSRAGVDVERLEADFVSYGTVRTHLQDCMGVETKREGGVTVAEARGTIEWARSRSEAVIERTLSRLRDADELAAGDLELTQVTRVTCTDCGTTHTVNDLLDQGGCDCGGA
jgi:hypothetical protein